MTTHKKYRHAINSLHQWGVPFLLQSKKDEHLPRLDSIELIKSLIEADSERLKLSVTAFFLIHPEYASDVKKVLSCVVKKSQELLKCYYTAAVYLQILWKFSFTSTNTTMLPDYFSQELGLPAPTLIESRRGLAALEEKFQKLAGHPYNYCASFESLVRLLTT
jgi:hypothetical protein